LAVCVAAASAWTPGAKDTCNRVNTEGGTIHLPHEIYCQAYYTCNLANNQEAMYCPGNLLFAYGTGIANCVGDGFSVFTCPKWPCSSQQDIGNRFPDTCCDKYWECTAFNVYTQKDCPAGQKYDMNTETCSVNANCPKSDFCFEEFPSSNFRDCHNSPSPSGDPCLYRSLNYANDRQCPVGTAFDSATCQCSQFNQACTASGISAEVLIENKQPDAQCRASGKIDFVSGRLQNGQFVTRSEKLNRNIDHYYYLTSGGLSASNSELVFSTSNTIVPFIYDYYYNDNILYAPLAITMTVRFSDNIQLNTVFNLLENRFSTDPSNTHCNPVTLRFTARYNGVQLTDSQWEFGISARGENLVDSTGTAAISGRPNDYYRIVFTFGQRSGNSIGIGGSVTNRGTTGSNQGRTVNFQTDNRSMGSALKPNKCGFAIGRGLSGSIREFSVHEGCSTFANLG